MNYKRKNSSNRVEDKKDELVNQVIVKQMELTLTLMRLNMAQKPKKGRAK